MGSLTFVESAFLWGSLAIAVPVVLHLAMRRQPRHLEFPALRFIRQHESANRRQLKLRHLLLLALRMAVVLLLAAALARPSLQGSGWLGDQEAPVAAALVFDTNPRLQYRYENHTRLHSARETAMWVLSQFPRDSEVAVIDSRYGSNVFAVDMGAARQRIERLETSATGAPLATIFGDALRLVGESTKPRQEVYVFTDLARSAWASPGAAALAKQLAARDGFGLYVIDVGVTEPQNVGINGLRLSHETLPKGAPLRIEANLVHIGAPSERQIELFLLDDKQEPHKRGEETVRFEQDGSAQVEFRLGGLDTGIHQGYLKLSGQDGLAADDTRWFSVEVTAAWKVLLAAPAPAADYALFLSEALAPYAMRIKGEAAFQPEIVSLDKLFQKPLRDYVAVGLLDPTPLPEDAWRQLEGYVSAGGGLAIFLGRNAMPVSAFNESAPQKLLPGKLLRQWRAGDREVALAPETLEHPLLAKFRQMQTSIPWDASPVYTHWQLGALAAGAGVVMPYSDTLPALIEQPIGRGRVLTMTTPVSDAANRADAWNLLPTSDDSWPFLILAQEMFSYLAGSSHSKLNYIAGETALIHLAPDQNRGLISLIPPHGEPLRQAVDERQSAVVVTNTDQAGNYRLAAGGEENGTRLGFSVNYPADVSALQRIAPDDLKAVFGDTPYRVARDRAEIKRDVNFGRVGRELYPILISLVVLALAAEQLLANRFYRAGAKQTRSAAANFVQDRSAASQQAAGQRAGGQPVGGLPASEPQPDASTDDASATATSAVPS